MRALVFLRSSSALAGVLALGCWLLASPVVLADSSEVEVEQLPAGTGNVDTSTCSFRGKRLFGKVKVVDSFPDIRVRAVASFPDLKVKKVDSFADECGEWQFVDSFPDFTIQYVDSFPDVEVAWVDSFPGLP
ncbi:MAG: hypothetical protein HC927_13815 [Deltaproteobacteria bacterium]|nr:hypothetical protein [Deltaproteobacteria bacterium]